MKKPLEKFIDIADEIHVPMFILAVENDNVLRFAKLNQAHERTTDMKSEDVVGKTLHEVFPERVAATITRNHLHCINTRQAYHYEEVLELNKGEIWWETTLSPVIEDGVVEGIVGIALDKTASKQVETNLADVIREFSRINKDLKLLTSTTAHDLRGPLRQAKLIYDLISEDFQDLGDNKLELIRTGQSVVDKALALIDTQLSHVSRTFDLDNSASTVDIGHWCSDIIAILDPLAKLRFSYPEMTIECEKFVLDIGLRNLVDNATKHARSEVRLEIEERQDGLVISVADDGPGFADPACEIGEAPPSERKPGASSGFGLTTTRDLIEARRGKLWIDPPRIGPTGATMSFSLRGRVISREPA